MQNLDYLLATGETITDSVCVGDGGLIDYDIHSVARDGLREGDEVILDIRGFSEQLVLIAGNPLQLELLEGAGKVKQVDLEAGEKLPTVVLREGQNQTCEVSPSTLYQYHNPSRLRPFIVRDHCDGFDLANEPKLEEIVEGTKRAFQHVLFSL